MTDREKVTIIVAWINLIDDKEANNSMIDNILQQKTESQLAWMKDHMLKTYTTDQMIQAAEKFSGTHVY